MKKINVIYTVDLGYFSKLAVSIMSIKKHIKDATVHVYVMVEDNLKGHSAIDKIVDLQDKGLEIEFLYFDEKWLEGYTYKQIAHISKVGLYRIFMDTVLRKDVEKIIYLDTDIYVCADLLELFNTNMNDCVLGAVVESAEEDVNFIKNNQQYLFDYYEGDEVYDKYFNSGVLVIDLIQYRNNCIREKCLELLKEHSEFICHDQDALNIVCKDKVKYLNSEWNRIWRRDLADGSEGSGCLAVREEDIKIIHYCTGWKPWYDPEYKLADFFWETAYDTEWYPELVKDLKEKAVRDVWRYKFPWKDIEVGSRIIFYGAGVVGRCFLKQLQLSRYCTVDAIVDKNAADVRNVDVDVFDIEGLKCIYQGQKIVIAINSQEIRNVVAEALCEEVGIKITDIVYERDYE